MPNRSIYFHRGLVSEKLKRVATLFAQNPAKFRMAQAPRIGISSHGEICLQVVFVENPYKVGYLYHGTAFSRASEESRQN